MGRRTYRVTLLQVSASVVAKLRHQQHILEHLFLQRLREALGRQDLLEHLLGHLSGGTTLAVLGLDGLEVGDDLLGRVVPAGSVDTGSQDLFAVEQDTLDEFAGVVIGVEQWDGRVCGDGQGEVVRALQVVQALARDVGHVEAGHEEGGRDSDLADVLLDVGLGVEVGDFGKLSAGDWKRTDVRQSRIF